jgi:hypothetical protein
VIGVAGCGDDPSAEERVRDARTELREAVDDVARSQALKPATSVTQ